MAVPSVDALRAVGQAAGLAAVGVASAERFDDTLVVLRSRKERGLHGGMHFTYGRPERSTDPERTMPTARRLVVGALSYRRTPPEEPEAGEARIAAYQWEPYYERLRAALGEIASMLVDAGFAAEVLSDDNRLVDRAAAHRAGLGWFGKNTNLLLPGLGSWFVLGSVLTDAPLEPVAEPVADGCGPCARCLPACPTGALTAPGELDARRCLAWLVQADGVFPIEHRAALGDRIYGCDDCQEVCPPNLGRARREGPTEPVDRRGAVVDAVEILELSNVELMERYGAWYIPRRQPAYLRRNALVVLGNVGDPTDLRLVDALRRLLGAEPLLAAHAVWTARRLGLDGLLEAVAEPTDELVAAELARPVQPLAATG
ncbi:MAG: tRNA epoxyqueuosine(34) reductase QueG [Actinomycetota bacterium]